MKKVAVILSAAALCGLFASSSFAASITGSTTIGNGTYAPSAKVGISLVSASTSYGATSCHLSGTLEYGTGGGAGFTGDPTKILSKAIPTQTGTVGTPDDPTATALPGTGWQ